MHVKHARVSGFRGINSLDWTVEGTLVGLVGPGDSTKTTLLDAIEYALTPRWSLPVSDSDFHGGKPSAPILIEVTVGDIPRELLKEEKFGLYIRGWTGNATILDEPDDDCEPVLTLRFEISPDLELSWTVVADRHPEGKPIHWRDRARLGVVRLGTEVQRELAWGKGSSLSRLTEAAEVEAVLSEAYRAARAVVAGHHLASLLEAANQAAARARQLGVKPTSDFRPALDSAAMSVQLGALSLHDGAVPVRAAGLGTRRLVALAIQRAVVPDGAILLIDEIEHALEPHRIRRLIRHLRKVTAARGEGQKKDGQHGQVIMTTHSPVTVVELTAEEGRVVRSRSGETKILAVDSDLQGVVRATPEALLGRRLVVCEGPTEVGLCWGLEDRWQHLHSGEPPACRGVVFVDGGGSGAPKRAMSLACLGFEVAYFADSDRVISPNEDEMAKAGIAVIRWDDSMSTEQRIFSDLPWELVQDALTLAIEEHGSESVLDAVAHHLGDVVNRLTPDVDSWTSLGVNEQDIRSALGLAAKKSDNRRGWYKRADRAQRLATILVKGLSRIQDTDLGRKLLALENWCYD